MITTISTMVEMDNVCHINRAAFDRIPVWREPVGVTQPEQPVMLEVHHHSGRRETLYLEPHYQLSREFTMFSAN